MKRLLTLLIIILFFTTARAQNITSAEYFFDADPGRGNGTAITISSPGDIVNFTAAASTASLGSGFHFIAIRVRDANGQWSLYEKRGFYISSSTVDAANIVAAEYFFDADPGVGNGTATSVGTTGAIVNFTAVIPTALSAGFHFLAIRTKGADGIWGLYEKRGFYISSSTIDAANIVAAEYFFDADPGVGNAILLAVTTPGGIVTQTFLIPEPGLTLGTHNLSIRVKGQDGIWGLYEYRSFTIGNSTIACPTNVIVSTGTGQCAAIVNSIDPTVNPAQSYTYTLTGATTATGTGTASGQTFNAGVTTVAYALTGSPSVNCSFTVTVNAVAPAITTQPASQSVCAGSNVTFTTVATGSGLTYQWRKGGVNIGGATSSSYTITGVVAGDAGNYDVVVSSPCGLSTTSSTAVLTVGVTSIGTQPVNQAVCPGNNVTFSVVASGAGLTYQWRKGGVSISGATSSSYTINGVVAGDAANYDVVVTGTCGIVTSNIATLTVNSITAISTNPLTQSVCAGANVTFTVAATGTGVLTYQWRKGGVNIGGATSSSYTINSVVAGDAGNYDVVVIGTCGSATSAAAVLTVNAVTVITVQPANQSSCIGGSVTFNVTATGTGLSYQWQKGGVNIGGATLSSYTINPVGAGNAATYTVIVTGTCGTITSGGATLTITAGTIINTQPTAQSSCLGGSVTFSVSASGSGTLTYQWKKNGVDIGGATLSSYTINPVTAGDAANYSVVVTSGCGSTASNSVALTIIPATAITVQPANQTVCSGANATFTVTATGNNLIYQWRKAGINISGATLSSYTIIAVAAGDVANYDVVVTGTCGAVTSTVVSLALGNVVIGTQPASQTVCAGNNVTFSVSATGSAITYQWRKGGVNIGGAISSSITLTGTTAADAGSYDVIVTGICGAATSNIATLTINTLPSITTQPSSQTVCAGSNVTFTVAATGTALTYQWRKGGANISGATSSAFAINGVVAGDAGNYDVVVSGTCSPFITSGTATLTIAQPPTISTQPVSQTVFIFSNVTFTVVAGGNGLTYQWRKGGVNISGATSPSFTITGIAVADAGNYDVVVTGTCSPAVISNIAVLTVNSVTITTQPVNQSVCTGSNVIFSVTANGVNLTYQWQVSTGGGPFTNISGATGSTLNLNSVAVSLSGAQYRCVVSGILNSNIVTLTVNPLPIVTLILPFDTLYRNSPQQTLFGGIPSGGVFTVTGISGTTFIPGTLALGNYTVTYQYTDANGCSSSATDVFTIIPQADKVNIFPNPAVNGNVTIIVTPDLVGGKAVAFNSAGQKMTGWNINSLYKTYQFNWPSGTYLIEFSWEDKRVIKKLIITR